jgi:hypothetical protein
VVHSVPPERAAAAWRLAARRRAATAYVTERSGPNPYDALPAWIPGAPGQGREELGSTA